MTDERSRIEARMRATIERNHLLPAEGRVVVAVSGGPDSLCLLGCLDALCGAGHAWPHVELIVAHLDHGLRGDSGRADAEWVASFAAGLGLPCVAGKRDVAALVRRAHRGVEDAARRARYAFLREVARAWDASRIYVGHTRDDQAETLILHWLRGSALSGMTGMRPLNGDIARPLLDLRRTQTHAYCALRGWTPRVDTSNDDRRLKRNRVRLDLLPVLERYNPNLVNTLARNAALLADDDALLEEMANTAGEQIARAADDHHIALDARQLAAQPLALRRRVLRRTLYALGAGALEVEVEARHIALLERLAVASARTGAVELPGGVRATLERDTLTLRRLRTPNKPARPRRVAEETPGDETPLPIPGSAKLLGSEWRVRATLLDPASGAPPPGTEDRATAADATARRLSPAAGSATDAGQAHMRAYVDADAAGEPLYVRAWRPGDRFRPFGMAGEKKVQDYFVDARVPRAERAHIPLVWGPSHLIWVAGHRLDDRVKLTSETRRVLALRLEPAPRHAATRTTADE